AIYSVDGAPGGSTITITKNTRLPIIHMEYCFIRNNTINSIYLDVDASVTQHNLPRTPLEFYPQNIAILIMDFTGALHYHLLANDSATCSAILFKALGGSSAVSSNSPFEIATDLVKVGSFGSAGGYSYTRITEPSMVDHSISLAPGTAYRLTATLNHNSSYTTGTFNNDCYFQWKNLTNGTLVGNVGYAGGGTGVSPTNNMNVAAEAIIDARSATSPTKVQIINVSNTYKYFPFGSVYIQELY
ncbi:MAG: hypothetical protein D6698_10515, partial [Gammaproteobacteria bacterium]